MLDPELPLGTTGPAEANDLMPSRATPYPRCDARFAAMLAGGAIEEVRLLLARGLDPSLPVMRAIGVAEIAAFLAGTATLADTEARGAQATRNYAKRQYTWLRHQPPAKWPRIEQNNYDIEDIFALLLRN